MYEKVHLPAGICQSISEGTSEFSGAHLCKFALNTCNDRKILLTSWSQTFPYMSVIVENNYSASSNKNLVRKNSI